MATSADTIVLYGTAIDASGAKRGADEFDAATRRMEGSARRVTVSQEDMREALARTNGDLSAAAKLVAQGSGVFEEAARKTEASANRSAAGVERITQAITRMQQAAAQSQADAFAAQLDTQMQKAEQSAMRLQRGLEGIRAAQQRMLQAAAQSQAGAMAGQISRLDPFQQQAAAADRASLSMSKLQSAMSTVAIASGALPGPLARVGNVLGQFAIGSAYMVAVMAGITAIAVLWQRVTEEARKAEEAHKAAIDRLDELARKSAMGAMGETERDVAIARKSLADQMTERARILREMQEAERLGPINDASALAAGMGGGGYRAAKDPAIAALRHRLALTDIEIDKYTQRIKAGEDEIARIRKEAAERRATEDEQALREREAALVRHLEWQKQQHEQEREFARNVAETLAGRAAANANPLVPLGELLSKQNTTTFFQDQADILNIWILPALREQLQLMERAAEEAERVAKAEAKRKEEIVRGASFGLFTSMMAQTGGLGSAISQGVSGGLSGAAGGPVGIALGATQGLVNGLMSWANAADQAAERARALTMQYETFIDAQKEMLGLMTPLEARIRAVTREFAAMRETMGATEENVKILEMIPEWLAGPWADEARRKLTQLNDLERQRIEQLEREAAEVRRLAMEDLEVRRLRAFGYEEEADALALAYQQQREYAEAVKRGADDMELATLKEIQRVEKINVAIEKTRAKIESLEGTISGLADFRNALLLSPELSPTQRLAEAQRQYEEILAKVLGGDQAAASRLPGAAQSFLDASRLVNASSPAFQSDFQRVLADTAAAIEKFTDLKTIEELQLEELIKIRGALQTELNDVLPPPPGGYPTLPTVDPEEIITQLEALIALQQEANRQLLKKLDRVIAAENETEATLRSGFGSVSGSQDAAF